MDDLSTEKVKAHPTVQLLSDVSLRERVKASQWEMVRERGSVQESGMLLVEVWEKMKVRELGAPSAVQLAGHLVRHSVGALAGHLVWH